MRVSAAFAARVEGAEAAMMCATVEAAIASGRAPRGFVRALGGGIATYVRAGSPLNKIIGAGIDAAIDADALASIEAALDARMEPARVELASLASPAAGEALTARGYRLLGFENVLVRPLPAGASVVGMVRVERVTTAAVAAWAALDAEASAAHDDTGVAVDRHARDAIAAAVDDFAAAPGFDRYFASVDGAAAGAASMYVHDGIAFMAGAATMSALRRRGVHAALLATRLHDAHARGAELAVITVAPGSQSEANVARHGFALAYVRAILTRWIT